MKKLLIATAVLLALATPALADSHIIKVGILMGFTGPIESLTVGIARAAEIALEEANDSGELLGGKMFKAVKADTTCVDAAVATASAERLINVEGVAAIVGALCSGYCTKCIFRFHLRCFIDDYHIEYFIQRQSLSNRCWGHH